MAYTGFFGSSDSKFNNILFNAGGVVGTEHECGDTLTVSDVAEVDGIYKRFADDTLTVTDSAVPIEDCRDTLTATDIAEIQLIPNWCGDKLTVTDVVSGFGGSALSGQSKDTLEFAMFDTLTIRGIKHFINEDKLTLTDEATGELTSNCFDTLTVTDEAKSAKYVTAGDDLNPSDAATGELKGHVYAEDFTNIYDEAYSSRLSILQANDVVSFFEQAHRSQAKSRQASDSLLVTDELARDIHYRSVDDVLTGTVTLAHSFAIAKQANDLLDAQDKASREPMGLNRKVEDVDSLQDLAAGSNVKKGFKLYPDVNNPNNNAYLLPEPELNNRENSINKLQRYRSETGQLYTYVQRTNRWRVYNWSFVIPYSQYKELESYLYARGQVPPSVSPQSNLNVYVDWRADKYRLRSTTSAIQAAHVNADLYRVELTFEGICYSYGGGRVHVPC